MENLPTQTKGVVTHKDRKVVYEFIPLTPIGDGDVLIRVHSAPINPSDLAFRKGHYPAGKSKPAGVGFEGSGFVAAAGSSEEAQALLHQKVSFFASGHPETTGSWGEYVVLSANNTYRIPGDLDYEQGACCLTNPLTVQGFINICKTKGITTIAHTPGASMMGKLLIAACKKSGIKLINFVRRAAQVEQLESIGADVVINTGEENWAQTTKKVFGEHKPAAFFDAVAGPVSSQIITLLPDGAVTYNYGCLSLKPLSVGATDMIFKRKVVQGYWLNYDFNDPKVGKELFKAAFENFEEGVFKTPISARYPQEQFKEAIDFYKKNMSAGKVLLQNPNFNEDKFQ